MKIKKGEITAYYLEVMAFTIIESFGNYGL